MSKLKKIGNVRNIEGALVQPVWQWKSNTYCILLVCDCVCVCVFVDLGIQQAMHMRRIAICGQPRSTKFLHIIS